MASCVRRLDLATSAVTLVAGDCYSPSSVTGNYPVGDGANAANVPAYRLMTPSAIAANATGVFIADSSPGALRVRFVNRVTNTVTTVIGNGSACPAGIDPTANGGAAVATSVCVGSLTALAWALDGSLLIADSSLFAIKKYFPSNGSLMTIAGGGGVAPTGAATGNGAPWLGAPIAPTALAVDLFSLLMAGFLACGRSPRTAP